ncbi:MAG: nitroreductase [Nitrospirae bacterium]|nr:nitroreductase [Nitrospirota bacterium]
MDAIECIKTRQSIRAFRPDPVPAEILNAVIAAAQWSPSYKNSQPWEAAVISGRRKAELSELLIGLLEKRAPLTPDITHPSGWPDAEAGRIERLFKLRGAATGIDLNDPEIVIKAKKANFSFYRAPHAIFLYQDSSLSMWSLFDMGLFAQTLMLAARAHGLGTVPQAFLTDYARETKAFLDIPESKRLVLGISIGYPDMNAPINKFRSDRDETANIVKWIE